MECCGSDPSGELADEDSGAIALLFLAPLLLIAQPNLLVKKRSTDAAVPYQGPSDFALPTACDGQGRIYVKLNAPGQGWPAQSIACGAIVLSSNIRHLGRIDESLCSAIGRWRFHDSTG